MLASFTLQQDYGVHIGTVIHVPFEAPSQTAAYNNPNVGVAEPEGSDGRLPRGRHRSHRVRIPVWYHSGVSPYTSRAFAHTVLPRTAMDYQYYVRLRHGAADIPRFDSAISTVNLGAGPVGASSEDGQAVSIEASIHPQAIGWWILAALAALVGLVVVGQALARQSTLESEDYPTMAALGVDRRQLVTLGTARHLVVGIAGAVGAVAIATALSPVAPLGEARLAESSTGFTFDSLVLPLGALATVTVVLALGMWPALRAARASPPDDRAATTRPSVVVAHLAALGAPPSTVIGVRNALERRTGGAAVPLGSALARNGAGRDLRCAPRGSSVPAFRTSRPRPSCRVTPSSSASARRGPGLLRKP